MLARDARKITEKAIIKQNSMENIFKLIQQTAKEGKNYIILANYHITDNQEEQLLNLGYKINRTYLHLEIAW